MQPTPFESSNPRLWPWARPQVAMKTSEVGIGPPAHPREVGASWFPYKTQKKGLHRQTRASGKPSGKPNLLRELLVPNKKGGSLKNDENHPLGKKVCTASASSSDSRILGLGPKVGSCMWRNPRQTLVDDSGYEVLRESKAWTIGFAPVHFVPILPQENCLSEEDFFVLESFLLLSNGLSKAMVTSGLIKSSVIHGMNH